MKKMYLLFVACIFFAKIRAQILPAPYIIPTIASMKTYAGPADSIYVVATNTNFIKCSSCKADGIRIFAGAAGNKWKKVVPSIPVTATTISKLRSLSKPSGSARYFTTDNRQEGFWYYDASDNSSVDNTGTVLVSGTKRFKRNFNGSLNVNWFGAFGDHSTVSDHAINAAISYANSNKINTVVIPQGWYMVKSAIRVKSDIHLDVDKATIELLPHSNSYLLTNDDLTNGNTNIEVSGGTWKGNGTLQTPGPGYPGSAFNFYKINNLKVSGLEIDSAKFGAIVHFGCNNFYFGHIHFRQLYAQGKNGDGISGSSSNGLYEDIHGYTNDDMIGILANNVDIENVVVKNIRCELLNPALVNVDSGYAQRAVRVFATNNHYVKNVIIEGISGTSNLNPIQIDSYDSSGSFYNIRISGVNVSMRQNASNTLNYAKYGYITLDHVKWFDSINVSNINSTMHPRKVSGSHFFQNDYSPFVINNSFGGKLIINNANFIRTNPDSVFIKRPFISDYKSGIQSVDINNVYYGDSVLNSAQILYRKTDGQFTRVNANNVRMKKDARGTILKEGTATLSINSPSFVVDSTSSAPKNK